MLIDSVASGIGYIVMILITFVFVLWLILAICSRIENKKKAEKYEHFISELERWGDTFRCEFPQMYFVLLMLRFELLHSKYSVEQIRDIARRDFPNYDPEQDGKDFGFPCYKYLSLEESNEN